eukprot:2233706-Ditylum_brightwellii.AAC.2
MEWAIWLKKKGWIKTKETRNATPRILWEHVNTMVHVGKDSQAYKNTHSYLHYQNSRGKYLLQNNLINHTVITQYHVLKGLKVFCKQGTNAILSELKQFHERMVMDPKKPEELANDEKHKLHFNTL